MRAENRWVWDEALGIEFWNLFAQLCEDQLELAVAKGGFRF